jgi:putative FmdB family regulatory protein
MPIYEYWCGKCGDFEVTQRITDDPLKRCPKCRGKVKKLISNTSFQLKGSGWYVTDYGRKGSGESKGESKSDSKNEAKGESKSGSGTGSSKAGDGESSKKGSSAKAA